MIRYDTDIEIHETPETETEISVKKIRPGKIGNFQGGEFEKDYNLHASTRPAQN